MLVSDLQSLSDGFQFGVHVVPSLPALPRRHQQPSLHGALEQSSQRSVPPGQTVQLDQARPGLAPQPLHTREKHVCTKCYFNYSYMQRTSLPINPVCSGQTRYFLHDLTSENSSASQLLLPLLSPDIYCWRDSNHRLTFKNSWI